MSANDKKRVLERSVANFNKLLPEIKLKMSEVKKFGDKAILAKYKNRNIPVTKLKVTKEEFVVAEKTASKKFKIALGQAIKNISTVNKSQLVNVLNSNLTRVIGNDILVWRSWKPLQSVGVYVPGGNANYPSTLLMSVIPAQIAGCKKIVVCCPPDKNGKLPVEVIIAAKTLGLIDLFKIGGPQAIAAMAYGTKSIPKVQKIVGPGNEYVTIAKRLIFPDTNIDMPAGPSENLIIADDSADPKFIAADLMTDCEHGIDSTGVLLTTSKTLCLKVNKEIEKQRAGLTTTNVINTSFKSYGAIIVFENTSDIIDFANNYAPEHMQIMTKNNMAIANKIINAGSIFLGPWTTKSAGDYATGANHVLPTGQMAKTFWPLSIETFGKLVQYQQVTKAGLKAIKDTITTFADVEKLPAHKNSVMVRFKK